MKTMQISSILAACLAAMLPAVKGEDYSGGYSSYSSIYGRNAYADSSSTYYDGYAQAWRYLGWYVDCNGGSDRYWSRSGSKSHSGSGDQQAYGNNFCQRYLMWAAYVDPNYGGRGIGEYAVFDTSNGYYDYTACETTGNGNCKLMDCHETSSDTWELMGIFKEASYFGNDAFFEQLFKHEGVCLWNNDDTYEFMSETRENSFSSGCLETGISDSYSRSLYIDLKPSFNGNMTYSLYTDYVCSQEYEGYDYNVEAVAANMGLLYGDYMEKWNEAMEVFKVCQPCRAYNLQNSYSSSSRNYGYNKYKNNNNNNNNNNDGGNDDGGSSSSGYWKYTGNRDLEADEEGDEEQRKLYQYKFSNYNNDDDGSSSNYNYNNNYQNYNGGQASYGWMTDDGYDPNNGYFRCDDDADYSNVNQCMKFRTHADLEAATWDDLVAATNQGGILTVNVSGTIFGSPFVSREQEEYLTYVRREKQAAYEKELEEKVAQALKEAPTAKSAVIIGQLWVAFGAVAFVFTGSRLAKQLLTQRTIKSKTLAEPLNKDAVLA